MVLSTILSCRCYNFCGKQLNVDWKALISGKVRMPGRPRVQLSMKDVKVSAAKKAKKDTKGSGEDVEVKVSAAKKNLPKEKDEGWGRRKTIGFRDG
uniref:Uncharacterized protein n=1 Tax=Ditylenchus dipsaci TaxID=166011 RepID=A0A915ERQ9_9BILA